jgi:hypothetical protein
MKKMISIVIGFATYFFVILITSGYENTKMHTSINEAIVDWFWYRSPSNYLPNNTLIKFSDLTVEGHKVVQGGKIAVNESITSMTPKEWIVHGGFSADEPQVPASLRHFYDPVSIDGVTYLTDFVENYAITYNQPLPKMDAKEWAISATDNPYNWKYAKEYLGNAFYNESKRSQYLGDAYRALGETLHLFADMGCPPHVRNDAHPAFANGYLGDPDPYEELIKSTQVLEYGTSNIQPDQVSAAAFKNAKTAAAIFETMALFTNKNFFTLDTQYGTDITPTINDRMPYTSPAVGSDVLHNPNDNYYYKTINGKQIKMLGKRSYFGWGKHTIDLACVKSQASVLIPTIVEGGANIIKLFIPTMSVTITDAKDDGSLSGTIKHTLNSEYTKEIKYNGKIKIYKGSAVIGEAACANNVISGTGLNIKKDEIIYAQLEVGGMFYKSEGVTVKEKPAGFDCLNSILACTKVSSFSIASYTFSDGSSSNDLNFGFPAGAEFTGNWFSDAQITWNGLSFEIQKMDIRNKTAPSGDTVYCKMQGRLSKDGSVLEEFSAKWIRHTYTDASWQNQYFINDKVTIYDFSYINLPLTKCDQYSKWFELDLNLSINNHVVKSSIYIYEMDIGGKPGAPIYTTRTNKESVASTFSKIRVSFQ